MKPFSFPHRLTHPGGGGFVCHRISRADAYRIFEDAYDHPTVRDILGLVWVPHFETFLAFNRGLLEVAE